MLIGRRTQSQQCTQRGCSSAPCRCSSGGVGTESIVGVKRSVEVIFKDPRTVIYDDFAHHPTAIGVLCKVYATRPAQRNLPSLNHPTMSLVLQSDLPWLCSGGPSYLVRGDNTTWDLYQLAQDCVIDARVEDDIERLIDSLLAIPH